jgi:hypothetical protein
MKMTGRDKEGARLVYGAPGEPPPPPPPPPVGTPRSDSVSGSVPAGQERLYQAVTMVPGSIFKALSGTGDADLYVRFGAAPTTALYNCRPYTDGSNETCQLTVPANATQAYVMVRGYAASSTFTLTRSWVEP